MVDGSWCPSLVVCHSQSKINFARLFGACTSLYIRHVGYSLLSLLRSDSLKNYFNYVHIMSWTNNSVLIMHCLLSCDFVTSLIVHMFNTASCFNANKHHNLDHVIPAPKTSLESIEINGRVVKKIY